MGTAFDEGNEGSKIVEGLITDKLRIFQRKWKASDLGRIRKGERLFEVEKGSYARSRTTGVDRPPWTRCSRSLGFEPVTGST